MMDLAMNFDTDECLVTAMFDNSCLVPDIQMQR